MISRFSRPVGTLIYGFENTKLLNRISLRFRTTPQASAALGSHTPKIICYANFMVVLWKRFAQNLWGIILLQFELITVRFAYVRDRNLTFP